MRGAWRGRGRVGEEERGGEREREGDGHGDGGGEEGADDGRQCAVLVGDGVPVAGGEERESGVPPEAQGGEEELSAEAAQQQGDERGGESAEASEE